MLHTELQLPFSMAHGVLVAPSMCAKRVEDLEIWQLANELRQKTYELMNSSKKPLDPKFQIGRAHV